MPRIADVVSFGGAVKRYEIQPDPGRLEAIRHHARAAGERHHARATPTSAATTCGRATRCRRCAAWA